MGDTTNILLIGSGGREHALAWKLRQSPRLGKLYCTPGNPGIADCGECVSLDVADHGAVVTFCRQNMVDLVVIGPELPLVAGLVDDLEKADIAAFGPTAAAAQLEGSKGFTKDLCTQYDIPTAAYQRFNNAPKAKAYARNHPLPMVIKADGLAAGKGVIIAETMPQAMDAIEGCFEGAYGEAGHEVVIEEFLEGEEASLFALCDGQTAMMIGTAQDHKRVGDGDTGPNTGGMGAYSPAPIMTQALIDEVMTDIIVPTLAGMHAKGTPFRGVLYAGLMLTADGPKLIEYNVRFGDPECQVLMMRLDSDLIDLLEASAKGSMLEVEAEFKDDVALTVVMASEGYPGSYEKGTPINGLTQAGSSDDITIFHAGTSIAEGQLVASGGRVLNVTATGKSVTEVAQKAYAATEKISWENGFYRRDIGWRAIEREK